MPTAACTPVSSTPSKAAPGGSMPSGSASGASSHRHLRARRPPPFRGDMNAIRDELPDATAVLDAFHVVKLAGNALDEVRGRVQQAALHRRGHKDDPLYRIRRTLLTGAEHLTDRQRQRLDRYLPVGDPHGESNSPGPSTRQSAASTTPRRRRVGREQAEKLLESPPHLPHQGDRPARPDASAVASRDPRLLHHRGPSPTAAPRTSTASSRRPDASRTASATSPTTASASCSPPTAHAPTDASHERPHQALNHAEPGKASMCLNSVVSTLEPQPPAAAQDVPRGCCAYAVLVSRANVTNLLVPIVRG